MSTPSKEGERFQLALPEISSEPENVYLRNLLTLGKMTATLGQYPPGYPTNHVALKEAESCLERGRGFKVKVGFLINPSLWLNDFEYPSIWLAKKGFDRETTPLGVFARDHDTIQIRLKGDGLVGLCVYNYSDSKSEYTKALKFPDPPEVRQKFRRVVTIVQLKHTNPYYVNYNAYPESVCPEARELLNEVTSYAVGEFLREGFTLPPLRLPDADSSQPLT